VDILRDFSFGETSCKDVFDNEAKCSIRIQNTVIKGIECVGRKTSSLKLFYWPPESEMCFLR